MAKTYWLTFGAGDPRVYTGLAPTLIVFKQSDNTAITGPAITEVTGTGFYYFTFGTTLPIAFLADAATTSPGPQGRYIRGILDPSDRADEYGSTLTAIGTTSVALGTTSVALGTTNVAIGTTVLYQVTNGTLTVTVAGIGSTLSSYGTDAADPVDLFGYLKRVIENLEGNNTFIKSSGSLSIYSRGSSQLLATKTIANSVSQVVKS